VRILRENLHGQGRGKSLRALARESGIAPSVLSRGERGQQDLRRAEYVERIAPHLGVRPSVMKRVAGALTADDLNSIRAGKGREGSTSQVLWSRLGREVEKLRGARAETLEAVLAYIEFLTARRNVG
jgi:transcriptional regulator with XRE-family HTH domain